MRNIIHTEKAPAAIGSYSQGVFAGNLLFLSGQVPLDPQTMTLVEGDISRHVVQVFENIKNVLEAAHSTLDNVVKLTVYLTDLSDVHAVNEGIAHYFKQPFPARTTIQVAGLPKNARIEIEAIAIKNEK
ncbi:MAG TPA: RidA family protein [Gammaproteobacteria bacterium]|nr:RidA family protein [Gammaproteobacteria bacterium]